MAILKDLIGKLASEAYDASPLGQIPIVGNLAKEKLADLAKKIDDYFHDYVNQIQKRAEEIMPHESEENREFVSNSAITCFGQIDTENLLTEKHYDSWVLAKEKTAAYLKKRQHLSDNDERLLKTYLPPLVEAAVRQLQLRLVEQPEFVNEAIGVHHEQIADLKDRVHTVEERSSTTVCATNLVEDIADELKNRWHDYPFLEQQRESGQKELSEFYKLPLGKPRKAGESVVDIHKLLQETINSGNDCHERMLVLLGAPGSGKTTVITYLLNKLRIDRPVRVYPLAEFINMNPANWPGELLTRMGLEQKDLCDSVLILDGLDELDLQGKYQSFVEKLRNAWAINNKIRNFTLILTCRTTRLDLYALRCKHVTLAPLSVEQIRKFAADYLGKCPPEFEACLAEKEDLCNVLGIPFLLYLVLGLGLTIDSGTSIADLYDEIFSVDGDNSIYKRCYNQQKHPITAALAEKIHLFSQKVAVAMFSKKEVQEELEEDSYILLAQNTIGERSADKLENLLIGQYFLLGHKEKKIYFVHRSILEYFVALSIFNALAELAKSNKTPEQLYKEMSPGANCSLTPLAVLLSLHRLSDFPEIKEFLHHLIHNNFKQLSLFADWTDLMRLFFKYGLVDAVPDRPHGGEKGTIEEGYRFINLLDICRCILLKDPSKRINLIPQEYHQKNKSSTSFYWILLHQVPHADLSNLYLSDINLYCANLVKTKFSRASLDKANLCRANLYSSNLYGADLSEANFSHANLSHTNLSRADLYRATLPNADLYCANLFKANLISANLHMANLVQTDLSGANLFKSDLSQANLSRARLSGANLSGANLSNVRLSKAIIPDNSNFAPRFSSF